MGSARAGSNPADVAILHCQKVPLPGFEPGLPLPQSGVLTTRLYKHLHAMVIQKQWRIRVSIPVPRRCERRTLPIELIPRCAVKGNLPTHTKKVPLPGFEPGSPLPQSGVLTTRL